MPSLLPYIVSADESEHEISFEIELAIAYLQSMSDDEPILDLVKVYYPYKVFETESGFKVFDLMGHNKGEVPLLVTNEINNNLKELAKNEDKKRMSLIKTCKKQLKDHHSEEIDIKYLVDESKIVHYLLDSKKINGNQTIELFQPILKKIKFHEKMNILEKTKKNTEDILKNHIKAGKTLQSIKNNADNEFEKEYKPLVKESEKTLTSLIKNNNKEIIKLDKEHKKIFDEIITDIDTRISEKKAEYNRIKMEIYHDPDEKNRVRKHKQALQKLNKTIEKLEKIRRNKIYSEKKKLISKKKKFQNKFEKTKRVETKKQEKVKKKHSPLRTELNDLLKLQKKLIAKLEEEEKTLSILINLAYDEGHDILVPFYINRKRDKFGFHPPSKTLAEKASSISLKGLFKYSLADKISEYVSPNTTAFNKYMKMVLDTLNSDSKLSQKYQKTICDLDLLDSRDNLISLQIGLYRLYEWEWINDKDYFLAQTKVVARLASHEVSRGGIRTQVN